MSCCLTLPVRPRAGCSDTLGSALSAPFPPSSRRNIANVPTGPTIPYPEGLYGLFTMNNRVSAQQPGWLLLTGLEGEGERREGKIRERGGKVYICLSRSVDAVPPNPLPDQAR